MLTLDCSRCGQRLVVKDELAGSRVRCPRCALVFEAPAAVPIVSVPASASRNGVTEPSSPEANTPCGTTEPGTSSSAEPPASINAAAPPPETVQLRPESPEKAAEEPTSEASVGPGATVQVAVSPQVGNETAILGNRVLQGRVDGIQVPGYEILEELGRGGMGVVYKARQIHLKRLVALKMILSGSHAGVEEIARFRGETEAVARLQHPNIVQIYEVGAHEDRPFCALEFVDGGSLASTLQGMPQPPRAAAEMVEALAGAMHYAHEHGIVHRDLKPANVLLSAAAYPLPGGRGSLSATGRDTLANRAGQSTGDSLAADHTQRPTVPKITDFGLAKKLDDDTGQTRSGAVMGTPSYMAPEQAAGKVRQLGPAADTYALGAILYEMLTGRPPFRGATVMDTLIMVMGDEPVPPGRLHSKVPRDLETICLKCLRKDPRQRYASALELASDLRRFLDGEPIQARPVGALEQLEKWVRRRPGVAALSAAVVLITFAALVVVTALWQRTRTAFFNEQSARVQETEARVQEAEARAKEERARKEADQQRQEAEERGAKLRRRAYAADITLACQMWDGGFLPPVLERLEATRPRPGEKDLRGLEWYLLWQRSHEDRLTLRGHTARVTAVVFTPDGRTVISSALDRTVRFWDADSGKAGAVLAVPGGANAMALAPNGQTLAVGSDDGAVHLWDLTVEPPRQGSSLRGHKQRVNCLAYSPDGATLATGAHDRTVKLWDMATGKVRRTLSGHTREIDGVVFAREGKLVASTQAGEEGLAILWDADTGEQRFALKHAGGVMSLAAAPDVNLLATASNDLKARFWAVKAGNIFRTISLGQVYGSLAFAPDGRSFAAGRATGNGPGDIRLWDVDTGTQLLTLKGHTDGQVVLAFAPDGRALVSGSRDGTVRLWDLGNRPRAWAKPDALAGFALSPDGRTMALGCGRAGGYGLVQLWDIAADRPRAVLRSFGDIARTVAFTPDGKTLAATTGSDRILKFFDVASAGFLRAFTLPDFIYSIAYTRDGKLLAVGSNSHVKLLDAATGQALADLEGLRGSIFAVAFAPDGSILASGGLDRMVVLWNVATRQRIATLTGHRQPVLALAFSPDGKSLVSTGGNQGFPGEVRVWDVADARQRAELAGHADYVTAARFARDGRTLATAGSDQVLRLWDPTTGKLLHALDGHTAGIHDLDFSPDGKTLLSASKDLTVKLWDLATGMERGCLSGRDDVCSLAWSPDGRTLAAGGYFGVRLLDSTTRERTLLKTGDYAVGVAWSPDGRLLASAEKDPKGNIFAPGRRGAARLWDASTAKQLAVLKECPAGVGAVSFAADGRTIAIGLGDGNCVLHDVASGKQRTIVSKSRWPVRSLAFSGDAAMLAVGHGDAWDNFPSEARLWDTASGQLLATLNGHAGPVGALAFSRSGALLATASDDRTIKLWNVAGRRELATLQGHAGHVRGLAFSVDDHRLITGSDDGMLKFWDVATHQDLATMRVSSGALRSLTLSPDGQTVAIGMGNSVTGRGDVKLLRAATPDEVAARTRAHP